MGARWTFPLKNCGMPSAINEGSKGTMTPTHISAKTLEAIEKALTNGDRVELIPVKDGVKVVRVRRDEIK